MSAAPLNPFPAPVGGVPFEKDFVPSVIISSLYAVLFFVGVFRLARSSTRTTVILGTFAFVTERVVIWALRAKQAKTPAEELDPKLTVYWQMTFTIAFVTMYGESMNFLRCLYVATTKGSSPSQSSLLGARSDSPEPYSEFNNSSYTLPMDEDQPLRRAKYRRMFLIISIFTLLPIISGMAMAYTYIWGEYYANKASIVEALRWVSAVGIFVLLLNVQALSTYALLRIPRIDRHAVFWVMTIAGILILIPVYHFSVVGHWTKSLISMDPGSQNTDGEKAAFYIFQAVPELLAASLILGLDVRNLFGTGLFGDKGRDPKPKDASKV